MGTFAIGNSSPAVFNGSVGSEHRKSSSLQAQDVSPVQRRWQRTLCEGRSRSTLWVPLPPGYVMQRGDGVKKRAEGIARVHQERMTPILAEQKKEEIKQRMALRRAQSLRAAVRENPNPELARRRAEMRERMAKPDFDPGLPLLGDATFSRGFYVPVASVKRSQSTLSLPAGGAKAASRDVEAGDALSGKDGGNSDTTITIVSGEQPPDIHRQDSEISITAMSCKLSSDIRYEEVETSIVAMSCKQLPDIRHQESGTTIAAESGKQLPGDEGISSETSESSDKSADRPRQTRGRRNKLRARPLSPFASTPVPAFSEKISSSTEKTKRNSSGSSTGSGTEAMSNGESAPLSAGSLASISQPFTALPQAAFVESAASIPLTQNGMVSIRPRQIPKPIVVISTYSSRTSSAEPPRPLSPTLSRRFSRPSSATLSRASSPAAETPKAKASAWVMTEHGRWERRTKVSEGKAESFAKRSRPVLTTWNRQLGSAVR